MSDNRWNFEGEFMVYTSNSLALASLETLVHITSLENIENYIYFEINIPNESVLSLSIDDLPSDWSSYPAPVNVRSLGSAWLESHESLALIVPSAIIPCEYNVLINPDHSNFEQIEISKPIPYYFDQRLR